MAVVNRKINYISRVTQWLRANRVSVNGAKTEIVIIRSQWKCSTKKLNFTVNDQKKETKKKQAKYTGVWLNKHLVINIS